ncbi:hypothetical protein H9P43_008932 [Blastocladiella emersonii ATCC 22665]|nr:hypothetical protein H9P43_008932 [Blastocladiella emersonii ATCC 22665]
MPSTTAPAAPTATQRRPFDNYARFDALPSSSGSDSEPDTPAPPAQPASNASRPATTANTTGANQHPILYTVLGDVVSAKVRWCMARWGVAHTDVEAPVGVHWWTALGLSPVPASSPGETNDDDDDATAQAAATSLTPTLSSLARLPLLSAERGHRTRAPADALMYIYARALLSRPGARIYPDARDVAEAALALEAVLDRDLAPRTQQVYWHVMAHPAHRAAYAAAIHAPIHAAVFRAAVAPAVLDVPWIGLRATADDAQRAFDAAERVLDTLLSVDPLLSRYTSTPIVAVGGKPRVSLVDPARTAAPTAADLALAAYLAPLVLPAASAPTVLPPGLPFLDPDADWHKDVAWVRARARLLVDRNPLAAWALATLEGPAVKPSGTRPSRYARAARPAWTGWSTMQLRLAAALPFAAFALLASMAVVAGYSRGGGVAGAVLALGVVWTTLVALIGAALLAPGLVASETKRRAKLAGAVVRELAGLARRVDSNGKIAVGPRVDSKDALAS